MLSDDGLDVLPEGRREAVRAWIARDLDDCVVCGTPVLISRAQKTNDGGVYHPDCGERREAEAEVAEPTSKNVAANARRADWG